MNEINSVYFNESLSIIIPLYNKEKNILSTLNNVTKYITSPALEIIIVENQSSDNSKQLVQNFIKTFSSSNVNMILIESDKGLGNALIKGFEYSKYDWIYFIPADFSFGISEIDFIVQNNLISSYELFIGSKGHKQSVITRSVSRKIYSYFFNRLLSILFSVPFSDTQGTVFFKRKLLNNILKLQSKDYLITTELILKCFKNQNKILEVPVTEYKTQTISSVSPITDGYKMLLGLLKLKFELQKKFN